MANDKTKQIAEVLKQAIRGEQEGHRFYGALADEATNDDAKRKLENLRDDEIRHEQTLRDIYERLVGSKVGELPEKATTVLSSVFRNGQLKERTNEMQYISLAIEVELATMKYYQDQRSLADDPEFQALFDQLAEEEHSHYELLQAEKDALSGNYSWFGYDESSPMEH